VLVLEEEALPVRRELGFNLRTGLYDAPLACKLFVFLRFGAEGAARFDKTYRSLVSDIGAQGGHPWSCHRPCHRRRNPSRARFRNGRPRGAERFDRTLEYYFASREDLDAFCASSLMQSVTDLARARMRRH